MQEHPITLPQLALIGGTRAIIGFGAGLLVSGLLDDKARRGAGIALVVSGILTTIPLAIMLFKRERARPEVGDSPVDFDLESSEAARKTAAKLSPDAHLA